MTNAEIDILKRYITLRALASHKDREKQEQEKQEQLWALQAFLEERDRMERKPCIQINIY